MTEFGAFIVEHESTIRLAAFVAILLIMTASEALAPRRQRLLPRLGRWIANLGIVVIDTLVLRLLFAVLATGVAAVAAERGWGLFNMLDLPYWLAFIASVLILDLVVYLQHVMFHAVPALWRLHMMHHTDMDFDVTTGIRFHPIEIVLSMILKMTVVAALGPPVAAVVVFEVLLNGTAMFNHANLRLPIGLDRVLRLLVVTPDMHRVHHSVIANETNSNFGFNFPWWDRLFGTYRAQPAAGHEGMTIGLETHRDPKRLTLGWLLILPFRGAVGRYPLNRRGREPDEAER